MGSYATMGFVGGCAPIIKDFREWLDKPKEVGHKFVRKLEARRVEIDDTTGMTREEMEEKASSLWKSGESAIKTKVYLLVLRQKYDRYMIVYRTPGKGGNYVTRLKTEFSDDDDIDAATTLQFMLDAAINDPRTFG